MFKRKKNLSAQHVAHAAHGQTGQPPIKKISRWQVFFKLLASSLPYYLPLVIYCFDLWLKKYFNQPSLNDMAEYFLNTGWGTVERDVYLTFILWVLIIPGAAAFGFALAMVVVRLIIYAVAQIAFGMMMPAFLTNEQSFFYAILKKILPPHVITPATPLVNNVLSKLVNHIVFLIKWLLIIIFIAINGVRLTRDIKLKEFLDGPQKTIIINNIQDRMTDRGRDFLKHILPFAHDRIDKMFPVRNKDDQQNNDQPDNAPNMATPPAPSDLAPTNNSPAAPVGDSASPTAPVSPAVPHSPMPRVTPNPAPLKNQRAP